MPDKMFISRPFLTPTDATETARLAEPEDRREEERLYSKPATESGGSAGADDDGHGHPANDDPNL